MRLSYIRLYLAGWIILLAGISGNVSAQETPGKEERIHPSGKTTIICYAGTEIHRVYIPPPEQFTKGKPGSKGGTGRIVVKYFGLPANAETAFDYAIAIWNSLIRTDVNIRVKVTWASMTGGTLGSTSIDDSDVIRGSVIGAYMPDALYPYPVAEKILGRNINDPGDFEFEMTLNSSANWYYGTDGQPQTKFDLVTVALHEIGHGLGFNSTFVEWDEMGWWGYVSGRTIPFDHFVKNGSGQQLMDTALFAMPSVVLLNQLQSGNIYFNSPIAKGANGGIAPRLYAPNPYDHGSSIYHLNESTYPSGNPNSLMTPYISPGEAIHSPGPITMAIFAELGWIHTRIAHDTLKDAETLDNPFTVTATITSDTTIKAGTRRLHWSTDTFKTTGSVLLSFTGNPNEYAADIPVPDTGVMVTYYLAATDYFDRVYTRPSGAPSRFYRFYVGRDTIPPVIEHKQPVSFVLLSVDTVDISAQVTDNIGIDSVYIQYLVNETLMVPAIMLPDTLNTYRGALIFSKGLLAIGDSIRYRIIAVDSALSANTASHPDSGYHIFYVEEIPDAVDAYENDFNSPTTDFLGNGFSVTTPAGFTNPALHTTHPYESPDQDNQTLEYIAQLKIPVRLKLSDSWMQYDEIVLVEPGEPGTVFGDEEFWDYVIVEGSKDNGKTWKPVIPGYDSRYNVVWNATYNSSIVGNNSTAIGLPGMYRQHKVNFLANGNFTGGDEILLRFRLFSDPYAHGWGWVIENLKIQGDVSSVEDNIFASGNIRLYPNPTDGIFIIEGELPEPFTTVDILVTDLLGREILRKTAEPAGERFSARLSLGDHPAGLYIIRLSAGHSHIVLKIMKSD